MTQILHYRPSELVPYINWTYFYHTWHTKAKQSPELKDDAMQLLKEMEGQQAHAIVLLCGANSDGDDIVLENGKRLPMLRQQHGDTCLCWADFLLPLSSGQRDTIGLFATSVEENKEEEQRTLVNESDDYQQLLRQTLADRLAEAAAERMHEEVRRNIWGYARDERLTPDELFKEKYTGRRPAVGYPSLPDQSLNFLIDDILDMKRIGISLTESGAMRPHASTSGLLFAHPQARHFAIGNIGSDQLNDYARRRGLPVETMQKFLSLNIII